MSDNRSEVFAFLISSQVQYAQQESFQNEIITIPRNAVSFLSVESYIQCFTLERLDEEKLMDAFENGNCEHKGKLSKRYLYKIRDAVAASKLLTQEEIETVLRVLNLPEA